MNIRRMLLIAALAVSMAQAQVFKMSGGDRESIGIGDTLVAPEDQDVTIRIEAGSRLLVKGGSTVILGGQGRALDAVLDDGQVFLDRGRPHELTSIRILTGGYTFIPTGTAAAVKTTHQGAPTVAVLRGSMRMQSAKGESVTVGPKQFGTVDNSGALVSGELNERGLAQLESWTGVKAEEAGANAASVALAASAAPSVDVNTSPAQPAPSAADNNSPSQPAPSADNSSLPSQSESSDDGKKSKQKKTQPQDGPLLPAAPSAAVPASAQAAQDSDDDSALPGRDKKDDGKNDPGQSTPLFSKPDFELGVGIVTVDGEPWTRFALGIDIPIWRFGVFLDLELFIDSDSKLSSKGWDFENNKAEFFYRKIRYIRYGRETDPLFVKFGGLSNVTLGYGMIMDRFTNMLHYPDEKLLGLQFYLNDVSSVGLSLQTLISDFSEMNDDGGVYAARLAFRPLKPTGIFLLDRLTVGGTYALDRNTWAPMRKWKGSSDDSLLVAVSKEDWFEQYKALYHQFNPEKDLDSVLARIKKESNIREGTNSFAVYGLDVGLPIIRSNFLSVDLYAQTAFRADSVKGWGVGVPGIAARLWKLWGNLEYRKVEGRFTPGYFDMYYLDERYSRGLLQDKSQYIDSVSLDGVFGRVGMDMYGLATVDGSYQYMWGDNNAKDQRYEMTAGFGETIMSRVPMFNRAEVYIRHTNVGLSYKYDKKGSMALDRNGDPEMGGLFDRSPFMYWGYRVGFEITKGASLVWDYRYGWKLENDKLVPNNYMILETALRF